MASTVLVPDPDPKDPDTERTHAQVRRALRRTPTDCHRFTLTQGAVLAADGRVVRVEGFEHCGDGLEVILDVDGRLERTSFADLCNWTAEMAPLAEGAFGEPMPDDPQWEALSEEEQLAAVSMAADLREMETGSRDGNLARARQLGLVDPRYDPLLVPNLADRIDAKCAELTARGVRGARPSSLRRKLKILHERGVMGLVDYRNLRRKDPLADIDQQVVDIVSGVIAEARTQSILSQRRHNVFARVALTRHGLANETTLKQARTLVRELSRDKSLHRTARSRQARNNQPLGVHRRITPARPGEIVQIDATPANVFVWSEHARWHKATILTAIDTYSRLILALRVVPGAVTTRDTSLLLWDMCQTDVRRAGLPRRLGRWTGVPRLVVVDSDQTRLPGESDSARTRSMLIGTKPAVRPSTIVVDHGKEFDAQHLMSVCARNGITMIFARPYVATDKGIVESWHNSLDEAQRLLPGYKGPNPQDHPRDATRDAVLTCADLQDMLWTWILTVYHNRPHQGLRDSRNPRLSASPNMVFDRHLLSGGHIEVSNDPYAPIQFLSDVRRKIGPSGIELHNRLFNSEALIEMRNRTQRGVGAKALEVTVYFDRWDLTRVYVRDQFDPTKWLCVPRQGQTLARQPFSEGIHRYAIDDDLRGVKPITGDEIERREAALREAFTTEQFLSRKERVLHAVETARQTTYAHDFEGFGSEMMNLAFPPTPAREPLLDGYEDAYEDDEEVFDYDDADFGDDEFYGPPR